MKFVKTLLASAALVASLGANAAVTGSLGGGFGTFLTLSGTGVAGSGGALSGSVSGTIVGGAVYAADQTFADDVLPTESFLAAGQTAGTPATLTFTAPAGGVDYISFLWGSPDTYNTLTVNSTGGGSQSFTTASMSFLVSNGDQSVNQSVQFAGIAGSKITSLVFASPTNAFEAAHFSVTPIPEPETYALLLAGLGAMGFVARRRKA